jgi:hypothetical protein
MWSNSSGTVLPGYDYGGNFRVTVRTLDLSGVGVPSRFADAQDIPLNGSGRYRWQCT